MSSSGTGEQRPQRPAPAEQHLGDRLAAFVDGELTDDSRDRVLAHLATCTQCKAAAAEQRRLKSVIAASELPVLSAGFLARLQSLPGSAGGEGPGRGGPWDPPGGPNGRGTSPHGPQGPELGEEPAGRFEGDLLGSSPLSPGPLGPGRFSYLGPARDLLAPAGSRSRGFRIHQPSVMPAAAGAAPAAGTSRGRRFAFAAAGAFSMAAIAIGGALPMEAALDGGGRPDDGPAVSPLNANSVSDTRGVTPRGVLGADDQWMTRAPLAGPTSAAAQAALSGPSPVLRTVSSVTPEVLDPARSTSVRR